MMVEYLYWISFYCTRGGRLISLTPCSDDKSSKDKVLRFKWETPLKIFCLFSCYDVFSLQKMPGFYVLHTVYGI